VSAAHGVRDFAVGEQADQRRPRDVEQIGRFLGGQQRVVRGDRDGHALGKGADDVAQHLVEVGRDLDLRPVRPDQLRSRGSLDIDQTSRKTNEIGRVLGR
jgi:hypothetical protein